MPESKEESTVRIGKRWVPPPLVLIGTLVVGIALSLLSPIRLFPLSYSVLGVAIVIAGAIFLTRGIKTFSQAGGSPDPEHAPTKLVTFGPYSYTRNPMYVGMVLLSLGTTVIFASPYFLILTLVLALMINYFSILPEELILEERFGQEYVEYKKRVRRWL